MTQFSAPTPRNRGVGGGSGLGLVGGEQRTSLAVGGGLGPIPGDERLQVLQQVLSLAGTVSGVVAQNRQRREDRNNTALRGEARRRADIDLPQIQQEIADGTIALGDDADPEAVANSIISARLGDRGGVFAEHYRDLLTGRVVSGLLDARGARQGREKGERLSLYADAAASSAEPQRLLEAWQDSVSTDPDLTERQRALLIFGPALDNAAAIGSSQQLAAVREAMEQVAPGSPVLSSQIQQADARIRSRVAQDQAVAEQRQFEAAQDAASALIEANDFDGARAIIGEYEGLSASARVALRGRIDAAHKQYDAERRKDATDRVDGLLNEIDRVAANLPPSLVAQEYERAQRVVEAMEGEFGGDWASQYVRRIAERIQSTSAGFDRREAEYAQRQVVGDVANELLSRSYNGGFAFAGLENQIVEVEVERTDGTVGVHRVEVSADNVRDLVTQQALAEAAQRGGNDPVQRAREQISWMKANNVTRHPEWSSVDGIEVVITRDGQVTPETSGRVAAWLQIKEIDPVFANQIVSGPSSTFLNVVDALFKHTGRSLDESMRMAARVGQARAESGIESPAPISIDRGKFNSRYKGKFPDVANRNDMLAHSMELAVLYRDAGIPEEIAIEEAIKDINRNIFKFDGYGNYARGIEPNTLENFEQVRDTIIQSAVAADSVLREAYPGGRGLTIRTLNGSFWEIVDRRTMIPVDTFRVFSPDDLNAINEHHAKERTAELLDRQRQNALRENARQSPEGRLYRRRLPPMF